MRVKEWRVLWVAEWSQKLRGSKKHPDGCLTSVTLVRSQSALLSTFSHLVRQSAGKWLSACKSLRSCPQPPRFLLATSVPSSDSFLVPCSCSASPVMSEVSPTKATPPSQTPVLVGLLSAIMIHPLGEKQFHRTTLLLTSECHPLWGLNDLSSLPNPSPLEELALRRDGEWGWGRT